MYYHLLKQHHREQKLKLIRFGEQGASTAGKPKKGESEKMKKKRASFKARHGKNIAKGKMSAAYWANKVKWQLGDPLLPLLIAQYFLCQIEFIAQGLDDLFVNGSLGDKVDIGDFISLSYAVRSVF